MGKVTGFIEFKRAKQPYRPVAERRGDWRQVMLPWPEEALRTQGARCMDCGIPFCHGGCPLGNLIPDWNDLVYRGDWREAIDRLHATNNFPEFTGTLCPAPCEGSCVLDINGDPVTIKADRAGHRRPGVGRGVDRSRPARLRTGKAVAVVGSGPAGLAAAQQLARAGHAVTVFERADRIGGLLRYGIPEFKMEKRALDRRLAQMEAEGVRFVTGAHVGASVPVADLRRDFDALLLAGGAAAPRDLPMPGRELAGIHFAMDYLTASEPPVRGGHHRRRGVHLGGGQARRHHRRGRHRGGLPGHRPPPGRRAPCISSRSCRARPTGAAPTTRGPNGRTSTGCPPPTRRAASASTRCPPGASSATRGELRGLEAMQVQVESTNGRLAFREVPGSEFTLPCDLVLLAMGFVGPERAGLLDDLGVRLTERGTVWRDEHWMTSVPGVFTAGDMQRGQSLIVWAIAEGRSAAHGIDRYLMGQSDLPAPLP